MSGYLISCFARHGRATTCGRNTNLLVECDKFNKSQNDEWQVGFTGQLSGHVDRILDPYIR